MLRFTFLMLCGCFVQTTFIISLKRSTFLPFRSAKMGHEADYPIWFGLRAPVRKGKKAYLVGGAIDDLFKPGNKRSKAEPEVVPVELDGLGIRDLAPLPDKRLLVVAGAPDGPEVTFQLFVVDPAKEKVTPIGPLSAVTQP
ncbi:hypothetical protein JQ628_34245, partial [Bradyrhizobium lablabi]|nr:hypothetical protein [Bradyrhizobium lablabi]